MRSRSIEITLPEFLSITLVIATALLILTAYLADRLGLPIDPTAILILLLIECAVILIGLRRAQRWPRLRFKRGETIGGALVFIGFFSYILLIARHASFLPISQSPDLIHHMSLIDFIQQQHSLPHDPLLEKYIGEMVNYSPGSHLLAALFGAWLKTDSLHLLQPWLAVWVALKAVFIYNIILRLLPAPLRSPSFALAGTIFLLFAWGYFLLSFIGQFYYPQVVAETFVIALLWAAIVWNDLPALEIIPFYALIGLAIWLTWPLWLPIGLAAPVGLILSRRNLTWPNKLKALGAVLGPTCLIALTSLITQGSSASILNSGGYVIRPSVETFGWPFLILTALGIVLNLHNQRTWPMLILSGAALIQIATLFGFEATLPATDYYFAFKIFHILVYPIAVFAALALHGLWQQMNGCLPKLLQAYWPKFAIILPAILLYMAARRDLPWSPATAVSEPVYQVGMWAKQNLPNSCVDYLVDQWATAYWLHINVLGNPRRADRSRAIVAGAGQQTWPPSWSDAARLPYVITNDWDKLPDQDRANLIILYQKGSAVAARRAGTIICGYSDLSIDQFLASLRHPQN